jgi:hypothetical protein
MNAKGISKIEMPFLLLSAFSRNDAFLKITVYF